MPKNTIINPKEGACAGCGLATNELYCEECGQRKQSRFTISYIWNEWLLLLNFDKGFLYNFYRLTTRPAQSLIAYLHGKTKPFYPPLPYFLMAMTVLLFLFTFGIRIIGVTFAGKINALLDDSKTYQFIEEYEYERFKKIQADQLFTLTNQIDTLDFRAIDTVYEGHEQLKKKINGFFVAYRAHHEAMQIAKKNENFGEYISYVVFYFMPLYLACFVAIFYKKTELFFTEHLVIQLFTMSQMIWFVNLVMLLVLVFSWIYTQLSGADNMPDLLANMQLGLVGFSFLYGFVYLYRVHKNVYQESWWVHTAKFVVTAVLTLATSYLAYNVMNTYFKKYFN